MMVFKRKQIVILALILMIVVAGYLQYSYRQGSTSADMNGKLGEAVYVDSEIENEGFAEFEVDTDDINPQISISASKEANDYFIQAKMNKELARSKSDEALSAITEDMNASTETKAEAHNKMMALVSNNEREMRIEALISKIGFAESFVLIADNGSIDIVVKTPSLTTAQSAQIADIVTRQADVDYEDIHLKTLY